MSMIDPQIFEQLKAKIDEDQKAREDLNQATQKLERDVSYAQGILSRIHATPRSRCECFLLSLYLMLSTNGMKMACCFPR